MSTDDLWYIAGNAVIGLGFWLYGYRWHKGARRAGPTTHQLFHVPQWLVKLSGTPRADSQLEIGSVILQVAGIVFLVVPSLMVLMGVDVYTRGVVSGLILVGSMVGAACATLVLMLVGHLTRE